MDIQKFLQRIQKTLFVLFDYDKAKFEITPHRDWLVLVVCFLVLLVLGAGVGYYLFIKIGVGGGAAQDVIQTQRSSTIDTSELDRVLYRERQKKEDYSRLLSTSPQFLDPD